MPDPPPDPAPDATVAFISAALAGADTLAWEWDLDSDRLCDMDKSHADGRPRRMHGTQTHVRVGLATGGGSGHPSNRLFTARRSRSE